MEGILFILGVFFMLPLIGTIPIINSNLLGFGQSSVCIRLKCAPWMSGPWLYPSLLHPWTTDALVFPVVYLKIVREETSQVRKASHMLRTSPRANSTAGLDSMEHCWYEPFSFKKLLKKWYEKSHETSLVVSLTLNSLQFCVTYKRIETLVLHLT